MKLRVMVAAVAFLIGGLVEVFAQDEVIVTNGLTQIAEQLCLDDGQLFYFPDGAGWEVYSIYDSLPMWIDFSEYGLATLKSNAAFSANACLLGQSHYGVEPLRVAVTLDLLTGTLTIRPACSSEVLASLPAPSGYEAGQWPADCRVVERLWEQWQIIQKDADWQVWYGKDAKPFITFHFAVADLNEKKIYDDNLAAEEAAWEEWLKSGGDTMDSSSGGGMSMMMVDSSNCNGCPVIETNEFRVCDISYDASNATATVTWESCNTHFYDVYSTEELSTNTIWNFRTNLLGQVSFIPWTDYDDLSVLTARFYRVSRLGSSGDPDNDGLANSLEALFGSNPYSVDSDGDGIWDGPFGTNVVGASDYSLSGVPDAFPSDPTRFLNVDSDPFTNMTVAMFKTVSVQTNASISGGDSGTEAFDLSSRGRALPYALGSNARDGFGHLSGGIYFNHDATNLYIGLAGLDIQGNNAFLLLLDTDGASGGVTNFAGMNTSTKPWGITQSRNLSFGTNFSPNVGILVGGRFGDGPFNKPGCILAINRTNVTLTVSVNTGYASTNLIDRTDTNTIPYSVLTTSSGTATNLSVPGRSYRVLAP